MLKGSLIVVGTGINAVGQITPEAKAWIEYADKVLHSVADPVTEIYVQSLNSNEESMKGFYAEDKPRILTYQQMVEHILMNVRSGLNVCAVFYGHPGLFVYASHESIAQAKREGYSARMLPGVSSLDCLFADMGIDPFESGCQILEATDFLVHNRFLDITGVVIMLQIGVVGDIYYKPTGVDARKLQILASTLQTYYGTEHEVIIYEAAQYSVCQPRIEKIPLSSLIDSNVTEISTLYIPPKENKEVDYGMVQKLGIMLES